MKGQPEGVDQGQHCVQRSAAGNLGPWDFCVGGGCLLGSPSQANTEQKESGCRAVGKEAGSFCFLRSHSFPSATGLVL